MPRRQHDIGTELLGCSSGLGPAVEMLSVECRCSENRRQQLDGKLALSIDRSGSLSLGFDDRILTSSRHDLGLRGN